MRDAHADRTLSSSHGLIDNRGRGGVGQEDDFALDLLSVAKGQPRQYGGDLPILAVGCVVLACG